MHHGQYLKKTVALEIDVDRGKGKILVTFNFPKKQSLQQTLHSCWQGLKQGFKR